MALFSCHGLPEMLKIFPIRRCEQFKKQNITNIDSDTLSTYTNILSM